MIYGAPGSGKTYLAGTAAQVPEMCDVLLVDNDGGSRTVRGKKMFEGIKILSMQGCGLEEYKTFLYWLTGSKRSSHEVEYLKAELGPSNQYRTIIIDNLGALHHAMITEVLETVNRSRVDDETPNLADYGLTRSRFHKVMEHFSKYSEATGVQFIFTAHTEILKTDFDELAKMRPAISGKLGYEVPGNMPIVGYLEASSGRSRIGQQKKKGGERTLYFDPTTKSKIEAKDQSELLGGMMAKPTMAKIYEALKPVRSR